MIGRLALVSLAALLSACGSLQETVFASAGSSGGDLARGQALTVQYGCVACHRIPGNRAAVGTVGPPLDGMASRRYVAGRLGNTVENMTLWIYDPKKVDPDTIMPITGVSLEEARAIAGYLHTLR